MLKYCSKCKKTISQDEFTYSIKYYKKALCRNHQTATPLAQKLFHAIRKEGVDCQLEFYDGYKSIDITIPESGLDIEVDGKHHLLNSEQLKKDLERTHWSKEDGIDTIRVPNHIVEEHLEQLAKSICSVAKERYRKRSNPYFEIVRDFIFINYYFLKNILSWFRDVLAFIFKKIRDRQNGD